jgi:transposase
MQSTVTLPIVGMDIAKNVFQLHVVDAETGEIRRHKLKREKVSTFFANHQKSFVAMEACGGAHHWARTLRALGHEVKLLPAHQVKPLVMRDKTDARDAHAIWVAAQQFHIRPVPVKSIQQQACLALHRLRAQLMKMRIMQTNGLRGLLYEFGIVLPEGHRILLQRIQGELAKAQEIGTLPGVVVVSVQEQLRRVESLQEDIEQLDRRLASMVKENQHMQALQAIPGIGPLTATALVSTATDLCSFDSGRQFAAWLGLTPRQTGTGGKIRQLGISKRGDPYVRTMLMHGARAVITRSTQTSWIQRLLQRRPFSVVVAALANKLARTVWAILVKGKAFDPLRWNPTESAAA